MGVEPSHQNVQPLTFIEYGFKTSVCATTIVGDCTIVLYTGVGCSTLFETEPVETKISNLSTPLNVNINDDKNLGYFFKVSNN